MPQLKKLENLRNKLCKKFAIERKNGLIEESRNTSRNIKAVDTQIKMIKGTGQIGK